MRFNKTAIKSIAATLVLGQLNMALQPLYAAVSQDKGASSPIAREQIRRLQALQQSMDEGKARQAQESLSPADLASQRLARVEELVRDIAYHGEQPQAEANAKQQSQDQVRAIGPNLKARLKPLTAEQKAQRHDRRQQLTAELKGLLGQQTQDQAAVRAEFAQTRQTLLDRKLPAEILARHDEAVAKFEQRVAQFNQSAGKAQQGDAQALAELQSFFDQNPTKRKAAPVDPAKLPWRTPEPTKRLPAETQTAWFQNLYANKGTRLAQVGNSLEGLEFVTPPEPGVAPTAADLAETPETQRTAAIKAKALELGNNPVNIQNWVRNNVEWVPTWGAIQSAQDTLDKKRGNAIDIASLEIALLRAAKIPARYQFGTIELPAEQVMNWVGGVSKPEAAQQLLGQGGIANRGLIEGGRISKIRMEHAWVQAYVNWLPSRGAKQSSATQHPSPQGQRNAWVPLDPSFKQYSYAPARDVSAGLPDTSNQLWTSLMSGSQLGDSGASIRNLNAYALAEKIEQYSRASAEQVRQLPAPPQAQDLVSRKILPVTVASILNGVLPYGVVGAASELSAVPAQLVHAVTLKLYGSTMDRVTESPIATYRLGLSSLSKRLGIRYYPASAQDEALLADYRQRPVAGIPAYLVRMVGRIELDGQAIAELPVSTMGAEQYWVAEMHDPSGVGSGEYDFKVVGAVGDEAVFGFNTSGVLEVNFPADKQGLTASETLHVLALNYWGQLDKTDATLALASDVVAVRLPSFGFFAQPLQVVYSWGVARSAYYAGRMMDVRRSYLSVVAKEGSLAKRDAFLDIEGAIASYYEGAVLDAMFGHGLGESVSAVSALMTANQAGQKIFSINAANHATIQPQLAGLSEDTRRTITDAVSMGADVIVSESRVLKGSWRGSGIIIKDASGQGRAYLIDGGANGGQESECDKDRRNNPKGVDVHSLLRGLASLFLVLLAILIAAAAIACILGTGGLCGGGLAPVAAAVGALFLAGTAAAQSLNFVPVMPLDGYGQVAWSVSHGKMIPWPVSAPDSVPRTCDPAVETALAIAKAAACNVPRSCDKGQSCPDYKVRIDNGLRCISARLEVMQACYPVGPGAFGDEPHWNELRRVVDTLGKCMCYSGEGACQITVGD